MNYLKKSMVLFLVFVLLIASVGCSKRATPQSVAESSQNTSSEEASANVDPPVSVEPEISSEAGPTGAIEVKEGYVAVPFAPSYYDSQLENLQDSGIRYTLQLPESWSVDGDGSESMAMIQAEDGINIGQLETNLIEDTSQLFADSDKIYSEISSKQEEFVVNAYPVKYYQLEAGVEGEEFTVQQHLYIIALDGLYLEYLFYPHFANRTPEVTEKYTEEFFKEVISSFIGIEN